MATLNVTNLQNTAATVTNVSLLADGSTTIVLDSTGTARTGGIRYNTGVLEVYDGAAWVAAGGGSGTVTGVTASLPLVSSGGATPNLTINAATAGALGAVQVGTNLQVTGGGTISIFDASDTQKGVVEMATAAEAATGTSTILAAPVAFSVPKDASGMTGAALLPGGANGGRPSSPVTGMLRYNSSTTPALLEYYNGSGWVYSSGFGGFQAWANFDGTTGVIRASANVSSVVVNGTGDYTVNFTNPLPNANYAVTIGIESVIGGAALGLTAPGGRATGSVGLLTTNTIGNLATTPAFSLNIVL